MLGKKTLPNPSAQKFILRKTIEGLYFLDFAQIRPYSSDLGKIETMIFQSIFLAFSGNSFSLILQHRTFCGASGALKFFSCNKNLSFLTGSY